MPQENLTILLLASQLPNLSCYRTSKRYNKQLETFRAGSDKILRNIQGEGKRSVSYKKNM